MNKIKLLVFLSFILTACASTPKIDYDLDSSYDLSKYVTYSIKYEEFNDPSQISLNPILIQRVERAIENHLEAKNFKISDNPDFIIKVLVGTDREINKSYESSSFLYPRQSNTISEFAIAGKMPPKPSLSFERSSINFRPSAMDFWVIRFGIRGSKGLKNLSKPNIRLPIHFPVGLVNL